MRRRAALAALPLSLLAACSATDPLGADLSRQPVRVVFFEDDSIALREQALAVVQDAAQVAARYPGQVVRVMGFVAPDPTHAPSVALSRARAEHVAAELARFGVPRGRIQIQGRGAVPFQSAEVESRRVEIHIGPA
ncbi:OmpA family protein [Falsiroseomonas sp. CW058]|uniref:OmpA family protein n=1 Tax=Falsiroseomonas sp. CW058 TaxID=3388664 RepID=UPI003D323D29